jgi:hypothetical protein
MANFEHGDIGDSFVWHEEDEQQLRELAERARQRAERLEREASAYAKSTIDELDDPPSEESALDAVFAEDEQRDSDEEIEDVVTKFIHIASALGVKDARLMNSERLQKLDKDYWHDIPLRDRILELWDDELGFLYPPTIEDLEEDEEITEDLIFRRAHQGTVEATDFLDGLGISRFELLEWGMTGSEQQKHAMRCLAWILKRDFMASYCKELQSRVEHLQAPLSFKSVAQEIIMDKSHEIKEQFEAHYIRQIPAEINPDQPVNTENKTHITFDPIVEKWTERMRRAYAIAQRELKVVLAVCEQVFVPDLETGRYESPPIDY